MSVIDDNIRIISDSFHTWSNYIQNELLEINMENDKPTIEDFLEEREDFIFSPAHSKCTGCFVDSFFDTYSKCMEIYADMKKGLTEKFKEKLNGVKKEKHNFSDSGFSAKLSDFYSKVGIVTACDAAEEKIKAKENNLFVSSFIKNIHNFFFYERLQSLIGKDKEHMNGLFSKTVKALFFIEDKRRKTTRTFDPTLKFAKKSLASFFLLLALSNPCFGEPAYNPNWKNIEKSNETISVDKYNSLVDKYENLFSNVVEKTIESVESIDKISGNEQKVVSKTSSGNFDPEFLETSVAVMRMLVIIQNNHSTGRKIEGLQNWKNEFSEKIPEVVKRITDDNNLFESFMRALKKSNFVPEYRRSWLSLSPERKNNIMNNFLNSIPKIKVAEKIDSDSYAEKFLELGLEYVNESKTKSESESVDTLER